MLLIVAEVWRLSTVWRKSFLVYQVAIVACFLGLISYTIYRSLDLSELLVGLLWLSAGILLLSAVIATIEKLEQKFRQKKGSDEP